MVVIDAELINHHFADLKTNQRKIITYLEFTSIEHQRFKLINFCSHIANETISAESNEIEFQSNYYRLKFKKCEKF